MNLDFEWDDVKAAENVRNHGVSFAQAALAFRDPFAVEWIDLRKAFGRGANRPTGHGRQSDIDRGVYRASATDQESFQAAGRQDEQGHYHRENAP